jgi:apolipoprotein D and lipocalin family protein
VFKLIVMFGLAFSTVPSFAETQTVDRVNLQRYLGTWYEVASIEQSFTRGCFCTRAQYGLNDDGSVSVLNTCNKESVTGNLTSARGYAYVTDTQSNAKLSVTFFWPFFGDYWIIGLDRQYRYSVVSNRDGTSLWILSRTPTLRPSLLREALAVAQKNGINTSLVRRTTQRNCRYP